MGLGDASDPLINPFSRGMQAAPGIGARALLHAPQRLILDELTNRLNPAGRREIHHLLRDIARTQRLGILLCTHMLHDVDRLCTHAGILDRGRTVVEGSLCKLLNPQQMARHFRTGVPTRRSPAPRWLLALNRTPQSRKLR